MISYDQLSHGVRELQPSATLRINEDSNRLIRQGRDIIKLGLGQSPFPVPDIVADTMRQYAGEKDYLPVRGLQKLRKTVASYYQKRDGVPRTADSVLVGPGSKELLFNLQMACNVELILPAPCWVSYAPQAFLLGRNVRHLETRPENQWRVLPKQLDQLEKKDTDSVQVLILNYPSNPTGCSYEPEHMKALAEAARRNDILIIADEIYGETRFDGVHHSIATYYPEGVVISSGLSKWCGAGGWRLGVMVFPAELAVLQDKMAVIASETFTSVSAPTQYAACTAFEYPTAVEKYLKQSRRVLKVVADYMHENLTRSGLEMVPAVGGFYLLVSFESFRDKLATRGITTSDQVCEQLLSKAGVAILPGSDFGLKSNRLFARLAYVDFDGQQSLAVAEKQKGTQLRNAFVESNCPRLVQACRRIDAWLRSLG
ncbi:aminotransferase class I/II-fold pyridoxal phosphate-dependent enzyme [Sansalvadorimonas sp. 2012CJ34-2]|uniref:Aminotransferase n=1 Tax=Parendozoicomonas callyspongiae TaxID=2942213 RepID=A0ABT0PHE1_9GAMM|nr:aminotransferase class I/II-fold pyridoxal phosphate-dependent enzyme [Sansalvadorimonas sp. 2012CJ34-2]MCL6270798.1 aminotransferase class I/II-fold pyridoxal phosphate-dependent enzyme [Sansalvadorimonas sp. 2012CJ34-2]